MTEPFVTNIDDVEPFEIPHHEDTIGRELVNPDRGSEHIVFRQSILQPGAHDYWHEHDEAEQCMFIQSGSGRIRFRNGDEESEYTFTAGSFIFIPPGTQHKTNITSDEPCKIIVTWSPPYESQDEWEPDEESE